MVILQVLFVLVLAVSLCFNAILWNALLDERQRRFDAEDWIDPVEWEATK